MNRWGDETVLSQTHNPLYQSMIGMPHHLLHNVVEVVVEGAGDGLKGAVVASVILMLAITVGAISKETGAGLYMVELLGQRIPSGFYR